MIRGMHYTIGENKVTTQLTLLSSKAIHAIVSPLFLKQSKANCEAKPTTCR